MRSLSEKLVERSPGLASGRRAAASPWGVGAFLRSGTVRALHLALWARVEGLEADDVDRMLAAATVVRATLMRVTLHALHAADHRTVHRAMTPTLRAARLNDRRFRATEVTPEEADAALTELVAWADEPRTNTEAEAWLTERGLADPMVWWAMRQYGPLRRSIDPASPWSFSTSTATYQAVEPPLPVQVPADVADAALGTSSSDTSPRSVPRRPGT